MVIPILIVLGTVSGGGSWDSGYENSQAAMTAAGELLFFGPLLMILFRQVPAVVVRLEPRPAAVRGTG